MGVGLVGARNVIHRHGGTISLASPGLGYGTVVSIRIPCDCYSEDSPVESSDASNSKAQNTEKGPLRIKVSRLMRLKSASPC